MYILFHTAAEGGSRVLLPFGSFRVYEPESTMGQKHVTIFHDNGSFKVLESFDTVMAILRVAHLRAENPDIASMLLNEPQQLGILRDHVLAE